jgi:hypothetical protein
MYMIYAIIVSVGIYVITIYLFWKTKRTMDEEKLNYEKSERTQKLQRQFNKVLIVQVGRGLYFVGRNFAVFNY